MKPILFLCLVSVIVIGCAAAPVPRAPVPPPTVAPLAPAQTTNTLAPTQEPGTTTVAPTQLATAAPTPIAPTELPVAPATLPTTLATDTPSPTPARQAPAILGQFKLLDLPGVGRGPGPLALLARTLYVANRASDNIGIVDGQAVRAFIPLDANPSALIADEARNRIYAGTSETPTLYLIENNQITKRGTAGGRINALAQDGDVLYVALDSDAIVERYDANTLAKKDELKLSQGFGVSALVLDKARNRLYAGIYGKIVAIDLNTFQELSTVEVPFLYSDFAVNPADGSIWGGAYDDASSRAYVVGYDPAGQEIARLFIGADLQPKMFDGTGRLYTLDHYNNAVYVIQTPQARLVATIPVNESPAGAVYDSVSNVVYVSNQDSDNISVIDGAALRANATIPLAADITAFESDPARHRVYAANGSTNAVYAIEGTKIVGQVSTGNTPVDLALDAALNRLYVANRADGTLTVIDTDKLSITASQFITRFLPTVAIDSVNHKLFAGSTLLDPATLEPQATFFAQGFTLNSQTTAQYERANPALKKLYALASNGVPGSNSRLTLYRFDYDDLSQSKYLGSKNYGNTTALVIDPTTNELFAANTHPLSYRSGLDVFNAQDEAVASLPMGARTTALVVNPATHHLFLAHALTYQPSVFLTPAPDNLVEILDTRTLGRVDVLPVPNSPFRMTLLDDTVYVASYEDGTITLIGDAVTNQPEAPTPTLTPSPYPTFAETPTPTRVSATVTPTQAAVVDCVNAIPVQFEPFREKVSEIGIAQLGCTRSAEMSADNFAYQPLEFGFMVDDYRDPNAKKVYVFFPDETYQVYDDTFRDGDNDNICPQVEVAQGKWRPKRGFGTVWCSNPVVQALGAGEQEEQNAPMTVQTFGNATLWFTEARGVLVLWNDGTWQ